MAAHHDAYRNGNSSGGDSSAGGADPRWEGKDVFTTGEAAQVCNVSQQTIIRCFDNGRLQGFRVPGSRFRRIPREELIRFMRDNEIPLEPLVGAGGPPEDASGAPRVLVVDDDPQILDVFAEALRDDAGYDVRTASTGYDAGMLTESFRPDVIVLDYMLPDINGNVVCRQLRSREEFASTRILFVSGVVGRDEIDKLMDAGADGFVPKPCDLNELMDKIAALIEGADARRARRA